MSSSSHSPSQPSAAHDAILDCIFDPSLSFNSMFGIVAQPSKRAPQASAPSQDAPQAASPQATHVTQVTSLPAAASPEALQAAELEKAAIADTESAMNDPDLPAARKEAFLLMAKDKLDRAIQLAPKRASLYNNRAQVLRFLDNCYSAVETTSQNPSTPPNSRHTKDIFEALDQAVALAAAPNEAGILKQAYTQRAIMHQLLGNLDEARRDHAKAAELGSDFSKKELVNLNPYAAMCNAMLTEVMAKLSEPRGQCSE